MVGIHLLKHRYDCSDEQAVETLHENVYWQCFCGFNSFQNGQILEATSLVKFRNRIGAEGMRQIEALLLKAWSDKGLVKTKRVAIDTTAQPKNIAYPTDADLLHRIREKIVRQIKRVREEVTLRSHPDCEFGAIVALTKNDDGLILSHAEYQQNVADVKTLCRVITGIKKNIGKSPREVTGNRGFDQSLNKQENCRRRWGVKRIAIPKKGKKPHPDSGKSWFRKSLKQRVKIEPIIGHLKSDHRMDRCRYREGSSREYR